MTITDSSSQAARDAWQNFWKATPVTPEQRAAQNAQAMRERYVDGSRDLGSYTTATPRSKWQQGTDSDFAYVEKIERQAYVVEEHLPAAELALVRADYDAAKARLTGAAPSHANLRPELERRSTGTNVGLVLATLRSLALRSSAADGVAGKSKPTAMSRVRHSVSRASP